MLRAWPLLLCLAALPAGHLALEIQTLDCNHFLATKTGDEAYCDGLGRNDSTFSNTPIIDGVYCYNDGTGKCKAFAGQFEFTFNSFTDEIYGPVPEDSNQGIDQYGKHKRVPISYNVDGKIVYADESINWARNFKNITQGRLLKILSVNSIDWCRYAKDDKWPYRSSVKDKKSQGRYSIWFFNRQTCIYDSKQGKSQIFNTRFLQNSTVRIDLDINTLLFAMEDNIANDIRIVKHHRQHWYESPYSIEEVDQTNLKYFVKFTPQSTPCKINGSGPHLFSKKSYRKFTSACVDESYSKRRTDVVDLNNDLFPTACGIDQYETIDLPQIYVDRKLDVVNHVGLHSIPRYPKESENFFGMDIQDDNQWRIFAQDGYTFTAMTTIPLDTNRVRVLCLYSGYKKSGSAPNQYDEYYPEPLFSDYTATFNPEGKPYWNLEDRDAKAKRLRNLNYVDDIAYLHKCETILIIFGPLYTEHPKDNFGIETASRIDSIYELGIWEMVNAFFAMPGTNTLYVYHRVNYVTTIDYTCAADANSLVTGKRTAKYSPAFGPNMLNIDKKYYKSGQPDFSEELFFSKLNIYKGSLDGPEAPDPNDYYVEQKPNLPPDEGDNTLIYIIVGVAILLIIAMIIISMITLRRRRKRRHLNADSTMTRRSGMASEHSPSKRSFLDSIMDTLTGGGASNATVRSSGVDAAGSGRPHHSTASTRTKRSSALAGSAGPSNHSRHHPGSAQTVRSGRESSSHRKNGQSQGHPHVSSTSTHRSGLSGRHSPSPGSLSHGKASGGSSAKHTPSLSGSHK